MADLDVKSELRITSRHHASDSQPGLVTFWNALLRFVLICKRYVHMYHICTHTYIYVCKCILHLHNPWIFLKIKYFLQMTRKLNTHRNIVNYKQKLHSFARTSPSQLYHGFLCIFPEKFSIIYQQG